MARFENVTVKRDIEVVQIPWGAKMELKAGTRVTITQSLGGSFTILTDMGHMVRVDGKDADALGKTIEGPKRAEVPAGADVSKEAVEKKVWDVLRATFDPEIPVNIVDLGLVYFCKVTPLDGANKVEVRFTLTAPGCGMGDILKNDIENKVNAIPGVAKADINVVFDPPWDRTMISEAARLQLGLY
ncbi:MAG: putative Fe-S cluster assembly protein SufT [Euryarchaeota archaeon]|nr:putative Fe-S cluster assembly protein SufT [Euryarchaeota archaeon]